MITDQETIDKVISYALDNGWDGICSDIGGNKKYLPLKSSMDIGCKGYPGHIYEIVSDYDFAKILWPQGWHKHVRAIFESDDPIGYLRDHRDWS